MLIKFRGLVDGTYHPSITKGDEVCILLSEGGLQTGKRLNINDHHWEVLEGMGRSRRFYLYMVKFLGKTTLATVFKVGAEVVEVKILMNNKKQKSEAPSVGHDTTPEPKGVSN
jgi:hypothetical protein